MKRANNTPESVFHDVKYSSYIVQYQGDIEAEFKNDPDNYVTIINSIYAIITLKILDNITVNINSIKYSSIVYIRPLAMLTLQEISPL